MDEIDHVAVANQDMGETSIYKELNRNSNKGFNQRKSQGQTMDTTNKASTKFGHRSRSVTKSNFGSTSQTDKSAMLFTKDLGLNKYVMKTLASHI
jgi:hypothetical protein